MSGPLLDLQSADTSADQLRHRRERLPERDAVQMAQDALNELEGRRLAFHGRLDGLAADVERAEAESHTIDEQRERLLKQLKTVIAPREAEALQHEITTLNERRSALDDAELEALEEQSNLEDELSLVLDEQPTLQSRLTEAESVLAVASADLESELSGLEAQLPTLRSAVSAEVLSRYDGRRKHDMVAAARLVGHRCEGCHIDLSAHEVDDVKDAIAEGGYADCPQCGRLLVI
jgi:predicted  nucleic acid-binding Zn-ribbon protein